MKNSNDDMKKLNTAIYIRLSREDGDGEESDSVVNQRTILRNYVETNNELTFCEEYVDDGYSGTNFNRPDFQRMINDIEAGKIQCVVVKDLSRFARDYIMAGLYIERIFPQKNVRFIAIGNNYDSVRAEKDGTDMLLPFLNVFNEFHARDTSKKVQRVMHEMQREGKCVAAFVPYGYQKDPLDKHHLVIDESAAIIVRRIFDMYLSGMGMQSIAKKLNLEGVLCPTMYKQVEGSNFVNSNLIDKKSMWVQCSVKRILENEIYTGTLVQGKSIRGINRKPKKVPKDKWIRVPDAHEAIISREQYEKAQFLIERNARSMPLDEPQSLFAGVLQCDTCGHSLAKTEWNGNVTYKCGTYRRKGKTFCTPHAIRLSVLCEIVLGDLNCLIGQIQDLKQMIEQGTHSDIKQFIDLKVKLQKELSNWERKKEESYDDYKDGLISRESFVSYSEKCDLQMKHLRSQIATFDEEEQKGDNFVKNEWVQKLLQTGKLEELDRETVLDMIDKIVVYENNEIEIVYKFSDELDYLFETMVEVS